MSAFDFQKRCKGNDYFLSCKSLWIFFQNFLLWGRKGRVVKPSFCRGRRVVELPFLRPVGAHPPAPLGAPFAPRYPDFLRLCHHRVANVLSSLAEHLSLLAGRIFRGTLDLYPKNVCCPLGAPFAPRSPEKKRPHLQRMQVGALSL